VLQVILLQVDFVILPVLYQDVTNALQVVLLHVFLVIVNRHLLMEAALKYVILHNRIVLHVRLVTKHNVHSV